MRQHPVHEQDNHGKGKDNMKKKQKSIMTIFLLPLLFVVVLQGVVPFSMLLSSGVKSVMESRTIGMDSHMVENRKVVLENDMVEKWSAIRNEEEKLQYELSGFLEENQVSIDEFQKDTKLQQAYVERMFPELIQELNRDVSCGVFLIMANSNPVEEPGDYVGCFIRNSDPDAVSPTNSDLLMERGNKNLASSQGIALDNSWSPKFDFKGRGNRDADLFFYEPYCVANENKTVDMESLGYWSMPFVLEDHAMDSHQMITYSVPLIYDGVVYGVVGSEISVQYISNYFPAYDLDADMNAGYILALDNGDGTYQKIIGNGTLFEAVCRDSDEYKLKKNKKNDLYRVEGATVGSQDIYAIPVSMNLYTNNVPYENTDWVLCGLVTENSIYGLGNQLYQRNLLVVLLGAVVGFVTMMIAIRNVSQPIYRLMESIRGGMAGLASFQPSNISEIDELHNVVENLTEKELQIANQLNEEKDRYRVAIESSGDVFFSYREWEKTVEFVNSKEHDGVWDVKEAWERIIKSLVPIEDRGRVRMVLDHDEGAVYEEFRCWNLADKELQWVVLCGEVSWDADKTRKRIAGYIRNIHKEKMSELEEKRSRSIDPVTELYRMSVGIQELYQERDLRAEGILILIDIEYFNSINKKYGLTFGNVILSELAHILSDACRGIREESILVRAGADELMAWIPSAEQIDCRQLIEQVQHDFSLLVRRNVLDLQIHAGMVVSDGTEDINLMIHRAQVAVADARRRNMELVEWNEVANPDREVKDFGEVISYDNIEQMDLSSLAFNLMDRSGSFEAAMDLLSTRLCKTFGMNGMLITSFKREYMTNGVEYWWNPKAVYKEKQSIVHCTETNYQTLQQNAELGKILTVEEALPMLPVLGEENTRNRGLVFPMTDGEQYVGSIFVLGVDEGILLMEEQSKLLREIIAIIQNRINLEKHDMSAKAKSEFLARMSHEIRTPMNGIIGMTEIALKENQTEEKRIECLKKVDESSKYLLGLLNDILDMSKIESGKMKLVEASFDFNKMLKSLHTVLDVKFEEKKQTFRKDIHLTHNWFYGDELRISQVLINLLSNAIKYSPENGMIDLVIKESPSENGYANVYFEVRDNGIGISKEDQNRIFQSFEQVDTASARQQGTGLGLAISSRLVHLMNSTILLESQLGQGSSFQFTLALKIDGEGKEKVNVPARELDFSTSRILVAEDNALNAEIIQSVLEDYGIMVDIAKDGVQAVQKFEDTIPYYYDMIIMDIMMPNMDGLEATHAIRTGRREDGATIPIVAMSANAFDEDEKRSIESGMNAHLSKPINVADLEEVLLKFLK